MRDVAIQPNSCFYPTRVDPHLLGIGSEVWIYFGIHTCWIYSGQPSTDPKFVAGRELFISKMMTVAFKIMSFAFKMMSLGRPAICSMRGDDSWQVDGAAWVFIGCVLVAAAAYLGGGVAIGKHRGVSLSRETGGTRIMGGARLHPHYNAMVVLAGLAKVNFSFKMMNHLLQKDELCIKIDKF